MTREEAEKLVVSLAIALRDMDRLYRHKGYRGEYEKAREAVIAAMISKETTAQIEDASTIS